MKIKTKAVILKSLIISTLLSSELCAELEVKKGWNLVALSVDTQIYYADIKSRFTEANTVWIYKDGLWYANSSHDQISKKLRELKIPYIKKIESGDGFWVDGTKDFTLNFKGSNYSILESIKLKDASSKNWTLLGTGTDVNVNDIVNAQQNTRAIWSYSDGKWSVFANTHELKSALASKGYNELEDIKGGSGFWINCSSDKHYDTLAVTPPSLPDVSLSLDEIK